jgi:TonB family protein
MFSHTSRGRWPRPYLRPLELGLLFPVVLSLSCTKLEQVDPYNGMAPQLIWSPPMAYPPTMFEGDVEGRVVVQAMVDTMGRVEANTIEVVSATRPEFERPAITMLRNSRFTPGRTGTHALRWKVRVPVVFDLKRGLGVGSADSAAAAALAFEGESLARRGNISDAQTAYSAALELDSQLNGSLQFWYALCWHGSLWGNADDVMFACEQAVALDPLLANPREARGLARALTSDYAGAIEDLEQSAARANTGEEKAQRLSWVETLRSGQNPFTEDVLRALRRRTT